MLRKGSLLRAARASVAPARVTRSALRTHCCPAGRRSGPPATQDALPRMCSCVSVLSLGKVLLPSPLAGPMLKVSQSPCGSLLYRRYFPLFKNNNNGERTWVRQPPTLPGGSAVFRRRCWPWLRQDRQGRSPETTRLSPTGSREFWTQKLKSSFRPFARRTAVKE